MQILEDALENLGLILFLQQEVGQLSILSLPQTQGYVNRYDIIARPTATIYHTSAIIARDTFYSLLEVHLCIVTFGLMYG